MGIALSMGQVWAVQNLVASSLINFAVFLHSPLLFVMATIGATIGTLIGAAFLPPDSLWEGKVSHSNSGCIGGVVIPKILNLFPRSTCHGLFKFSSLCRNMGI